MYSINLLKVESIKKIINEIIIEAIMTTIPLLCNSDQVGQLTLFSNSSEDSSIYVLSFDINLFSSHGWRDSNSQPMVLETTTLPIELHPFGFIKVTKRYPEISGHLSCNYLSIPSILLDDFSYLTCSYCSTTLTDCKL